MKTLNELKELATVEFEKVWTSSRGIVDKKMVKYCVDKVTGIVELSDGGFVCFEKPSIQTSFCFGYGFCGCSTTEESDAAAAMVKAAREKEYFVNENMSVFNKYEKLLESDNLYVTQEYYRAKEDSKIYRVISLDDARYERLGVNKLYKITTEDIENLKKELFNQKVKFAKRLETYWKKYGNTKLRTWSFLMD